MATSTPSKSSDRLGQCVVCGKETKQRWSSCARGGLNWVYFCGVKHQKLIWKVHKRVCGRNPFKWPGYTDEEVEEAWKNRNASVKSKTVLETFEAALTPDVLICPDTSSGVDKKKAIEVLFKLYLEQCQESLLNKNSNLAISRQRAIGMTAKMMLAQSTSSDLDTLRLFSNEPLDLLAMVEARHGDELEKFMVWPSDLQHRLVILFAILANGIKKSIGSGVKYECRKDPHVVHSLSIIFLSGLARSFEVEDQVRARKCVEEAINFVLTSIDLAKVSSS